MEMYHWYKIDWHVKFEKSMQVIGLCERSGHAYSHTMRLLIEYFPPPISSPRKNSSTTSSIARMSAAGLLPLC